MSTLPVPDVLSIDEARRLTDDVKADAAAMWAKLLTLYEGGAHTVLGYSWADYCATEFDVSTPHVEMPPSPRLGGPCSVYMLKDAGYHVLYVGMSSRTLGRLGQHGSKPWWTEVALVDVEHFPSRDAAREREAELIRALQPPYNTQHNEAALASRAEWRRAADWFWGPGNVPDDIRWGE